VASRSPEPQTAAEYVRQASAPAVAFAATSLALACTATPAGVLHRLLTLHGVSGRFVGSLGLALAMFVGLSAAALVLSRSAGCGPFLCAGAVLAAVGVGLGDVVDDGDQLNLAALVLGSAAGCLTGGAASMPFELPWRPARRVAVCWVVPLVAGWPVIAWLVRADTRISAGLVVPHVSGLAYLAATMVVAWGVLAVVLTPAQARSPSYGWRDAWLAVSSAAGVVTVLAMVLGFDARLRLFWLRPVVLVVASLCVAIWLLVMMLVPSPAAKISYLAATLTGAAIPTTTQFLVVADSLASSTSALPVRIGAVLVAAAVGLVAGWRHPRRSVIAGLLAVSLIAVLAWFGFTSAWVSTALTACLVAAAVAVVAGAMALALESEAALRFVSFAFVTGLVVGLLLGVPVGWALVGDLPLTASSSRVFVRVLLGLAFSASVLIAAQSAVLGRRIDRRLASAARVSS
jgi:hypothetical protein